MYLKITVYDDKKLAAVWLTKAEDQDTALQEQLRQMYRDYTDKKYKVAVFHSGNDSFYECLRDLVFYNRRRSAELEVKREKLEKFPPILAGHSETMQIQC
jgi:GTPase SAR1 family protein